VPPTWDSSIRFAGKPFNGLVLTASGGRTGFITVSLANNGKRPIRVRKWDGSSGYDVFVRRSEEKLVRLLLADKALVKSRSGLEIIELKPQGAIDEKIPVADFSDFRTPGDYTVLVRLPMIGDVDAVLTAAPVTIRIDAPPPTENK
jgi:hypothetical protein